MASPAATERSMVQVKFTDEPESTPTIPDPQKSWHDMSWAERNAEDRLKESGGNASKLSIRNFDDLDEAIASGLFEVDDKYSRTVFQDCAVMPAVILMNHGRFDDLSLGDVQDLFRTLDADGSGKLDFEELALFFQEVLDPPCTQTQLEVIYELTEQHETGVTPKELYTALTSGPVKEHLKILQRENRLKNQIEAHLGVNKKVDRELMVERLKFSVEQDDSFRTLPFSLVYISLFIFLVVAHLNIWERQQVERGLQNWMEGYGAKLEGPYLTEHIADAPSAFDWMKKSGLPAILGVCQNASTGLFSCHVGPRNLLVGDISLKQIRPDGSELSVWLLHSAEAQIHLKAKPGDYLGAANVAIKQLELTNWASADTNGLHFRYDVYGLESQMFAIVEIRVAFDKFGVCSSRVVTSAVPVRSYPSNLIMMVIYATVDVLYVLFWFLPMLQETKTLILHMKHVGIADGFFGYWGLWNCVDWLAIIMGIVLTIIWMNTCLAMEAIEVQALLVQSDGQWSLTPTAMGLDVGTLEVVQERFATITSMHFTMHLVMGATVVCIMLKFFKAFQANPRLQLVTDTLVRAASDIFHFSVVFCAVFLGFAVTGHIFLGTDLPQFRSFGSSIDTCFIVLMGEFGWYADASISEEGLSSGLPYIILMIWFWFFMVFVLLIMINMLLAIVLEHYTELVHEVSKDDEAIALWTQTARYIEKRRHTKDHIPLGHLLMQLEDDDTPCHTDPKVTKESLQDSFPKMTHTEAAHLYDWLKAAAVRGSVDYDDEMLVRMKAMGEHVDQLAADLHVVKLNVAVCTSTLKHAQGDHGDHGATRQSRPNNMHELVEGLTLKVGEAVQQMSWQIGGATDKLISQGSALVANAACTTNSGVVVKPLSGATAQTATNHGAPLSGAAAHLLARP